MDIVEGGQERHRFGALQILWGKTDFAGVVLPRLAESLRTADDPSFRAVLVNTIGSLGPESLDTILPEIQSKSPQVRLAAWGAIISYSDGTKRAIPYLVAAARDPMYGDRDLVLFMLRDVLGARDLQGVYEFLAGYEG